MSEPAVMTDPVDCPNRVDVSAATWGPGRLFEHFLCRVAGLPMRCIEGLRATRTIPVLKELLAIEDDLAADRSELVERLFGLVGDVGDRRRRGRLLRIKRDLHNRRPIRAVDLEQVADLLPVDIARELDHLHELGDRRRHLRTAVEKTYRDDVRICRQHFRDAIREADFQKGLRLSSRDLSAGLHRYLRVAVDAVGAKERQIERGLMRYLSRMVMKATPFGTFCAIAPGHRGSQDLEELIFTGDPRGKSSLVRLNKSLYVGLVQELLSHDAIRERVGVELNPTLVRQRDHWLFLAASGARETFQRLPCSPVVDLFCELAAASGLTLGELRRAAAAAVDSSTEEIRAFTERLLEIGFLRLRLGIREQEIHWDRPLRRFLATIDDPRATSAVTFLEELRCLCDAFATASVDERDDLLTAAEELIGSSYPEALKAAAVKLELPFLEDSSATAELAVPAAGVDAVAADLADFLGWVSRFSWPRHEHASMRHFFDTFYGEGHGPVALLRFYEDYYREHFKDYLRHERAAEMGIGAEDAAKDAVEPLDLLNPFDLEVVERMKAASRGLEDLIVARWQRDPEAEEVRFDRADLERLTSGLPKPGDDGRSVSIFGQYLPTSGDGRPAFVARNFLAGYGKYFSRFLELLPESVTEDLVAGNRDLGDELLAEICGDGGFNGNLHPSLVDWEIDTPGSDGGAGEGRLPIAELTVEPTPGDRHALCLRHTGSGHRVTPIDLGFQNPRTRPPLFQLLSRFSPASNFTLRIPGLPWPSVEETVDGTADKTVAERPEVVARPRIVYGDGVILARRQWTVRGAAYPRRHTRETDLDYHLRVHRWRRRHGVPREVFLRILVAPGRKSDKARRHHLHKPQYIDFDNPFLVDLFGRAVENFETFKAELCERLPTREQSACSGEDFYATELVLQMDFPTIGAPVAGTEDPKSSQEGASNAS